MDFVLGGSLGALYLTKPCHHQSLEGRTAIVTGSNIGLGFETVLHLAKLNPASIIIACRDLVKGQNARTLVIEQTGFKGVIEVWQLDLASFESVKAFAARMNGLERLDIIIQNAGIANFEFKKTDDDWEQILQVNVISTGLLSLLALPILAKTAKNPLPFQAAFKPHLTIVSSELHGWAKFPQAEAENSLQALNQPQAIGSDRYNVTKLIEVFIARELATLPISLASGLVINSVNPGLCVSAIFRDIRRDYFGFLLNFFSRSGEQGARNIAWAALEDTSATPGAYVSFCRVMKPGFNSTNERGLRTQRKVFKELVEVWAEIAPEVKEILG